MNWYHFDIKINVYLIYIEVLDDSFVYDDQLGGSKLFISTLSFVLLSALFKLFVEFPKLSLFRPNILQI